MKLYDALLLVRDPNAVHLDERASGDIYEDTMTYGYHPFSDGTQVSTSEVVSKKDGIITTHSGSRYKLITERPPLSVERTARQLLSGFEFHMFDVLDANRVCLPPQNANALRALQRALEQNNA